MPKRSRKAQGNSSDKRVFHTKQKPKPRHTSKAHLEEREENRSAFDVLNRIFELSSDETPEKNPAAVALGRLGGLKGGNARAEKLTPEQRRKSAMKAARARWAAKKDSQ